MANIATEADRHRWYCMQSTPGGQARDVKRCKHGKMLQGYGVLGSTNTHWAGLSPFWNPIQYWRACQALREEK